jgi:hypothetical protein
MALVEDFKSKLCQVINKYPPSDQFNADEAGLFHPQMPRKSVIGNAACPHALKEQQIDT